MEWRKIPRTLFRKIHGAYEIGKMHGLQRLCRMALDRAGIIVRREGGFYELSLNDRIIFDKHESVMGLEFIAIRNEDELGSCEFPADDKWMKKDLAVRWLREAHCELLALKSKNRIVAYNWFWFSSMRVQFLDLVLALPDNTAYLSALYTMPEFRGKKIASHLKGFVLQYLYEHGYKHVFLIIEPENVASQKTNNKFGFREYQTVLFRRFIFIRYYRLKDCTTNKAKIFWSIMGKGLELWKIFSKFKTADAPSKLQ
jgi:ribosomal protein S18 acetylase RimI-like enzyme